MAAVLREGGPRITRLKVGWPRRGASQLGWGGLIAVVMIGLFSGGLSSAIALLGAYILVVGIVGAIRGRVNWAGLHRRAAGALTMLAGLVAVTLGGALQPAVAPTTNLPASTSEAQATPTVATSTSMTTTSTPTAPTASSVTPKPGTALAALAQLQVMEQGSLGGFRRAAFGESWSDVDRNGCDQRNDVLRRDLTRRTLKAGTNGCVVMTGTLGDPYSDATVAFNRTSSHQTVEVDHVVSLADAWRKGAVNWTVSKRTALANDLLNLLAVSASTNASKGDQDASTWLPAAPANQCAFVARQIAVKVKYHIGISSVERDAMGSILDTCPAVKLPVAETVPLWGAPVYQAPKPKPSVTHVPPPAAPRTDPRFGTCREAKASGFGPYRQGVDPEYDWYRDADHDGVVCE